MHRIAIIGLGQIGASIGMELRGKLPDIEIVGHDIEPETAGMARKKGAVDRISYSLPGAVEDAAIVFVAVPLTAVRDVLAAIGPALSPGAIVTDTSSTKVNVLSWAEEILPESVEFVGGHPMAGVETPGVAGAQTGLFDGTTYVVIPLARTAETAVKTVVELVGLLGARHYFMDPTEHDGLVAAVSHLPIALSITLMTTVTRSPSWREMAGLAAGSFRDVSRLASASPAMHHGIFTTNKEAVLRWVDEYQAELQHFRAAVERGGEALMRTLVDAYEARDAWLRGRVVQTEAHKAFSELPTSSENIMSAFGGDRLAQLGRLVAQKEEDSTRRRERGG
ncbi:MAG: prephenate dehydrogenase/arogenate dehydrogenase family protein [Chloroflexi bacterium]|nr:prephenate dehydrogenase/arogenate dehydrogenase family protein [Chloroflexota bacterium]